MSKEQAKAELVKLIAKCKDLEQSGGLKRMSEADTKRKFIEPLFEALGWDFTNPQETVLEENVAGNKADYGFYLNSRPQFYLEAKAAAADVHSEDFAKQAWKYAWNKSIPWAVLTNFKILKVFNAEGTSKRILDHKVLELNLENYIQEFDDLWLLSKEAFLQNSLDVFAEKIGKKAGKVTVTETLAKDLNRIRQALIEAFRISNPKLDLELIEEGVQKMIDRLIFIRVAEDRGIEGQTLKPLMREWKTKGSQGSIFAHMVSKFRELDAVYNSDLFSKHALESWEEYHADMENILQILYGEPDNYEYDFKVMPADVLGAVYENYLGYKLQKTKKDLFGQDMALGKDSRKRKEQGIYYTPKFIVDYIVQNALGPILKECGSVEQLKKIKILDPACGSGSFLVAAFGEIVKKYQEFGYKPDAYLKMNILKENIYGVDLDSQAVQLARLNLLLNVFDSKTKLQNLDHNIKNGNSLISGPDEELKKYFGKDFRDKKPFNWQEEFPDVFKQGGFDCIIGNPPWGANIDKDAEYLAQKYPNSTKAHKDTYKIFIDLSLDKLKPNGTLGFVVPNTFLYQPRYQDIKDLLEQYKYFSVNLGEKIFGNVELPCCLLVVEKYNSKEHGVIDLTKIDRNELGTVIWTATPETAAKSSAISASISKNTGLTFDEVFAMKDAGINYQAVKVGKGEKGNSKLSEQLFYEGVHQKSSDVEYWKGSNIEKYFIALETKQFVRTDYKEFKKSNERVILNKDFFAIIPKIIWRQTASSIIATIDEKGIWFGRSVIGAVIQVDYKKKINIYFALAIFNSKYIDYLYHQKVLEIGKVFPQVKLKYLRDLPFVIAKPKQQEVISLLAKKMVELNKKVREVTENSNDWQKLKDEITKIDQKIDREVYKLYGLTEEEIKIVEG